VVRIAVRALAADSTDAEAQRRAGAETQTGGSAGVVALLRSVEVTVTDTGVGIPPDDVEKVFEPFVTSKDGGTGLGLPISRQIALEHGGTLRCESVPGHGTTFRLTLPIPDDEESQR
jgi:signal transduction histidine kinase